MKKKHLKKFIWAGYIFGDGDTPPLVPTKIDIVWDNAAVTPIPPNTGVNRFPLGSSSLVPNLVTQDNVATTVAIQRTLGSPATAITGAECTDPRWNATMSNDSDFTGSSVTYTITGLNPNEVVDLNLFSSTNGGGTMAYWLQGVRKENFICGDNVNSKVYTGIIANGSGVITVEVDQVDLGGVACICCLGIDRLTPLPPATVADAPVLTSLNPIGIIQEIEVNWNKSVSDGGSEITWYVVESNYENGVWEFAGQVAHTGAATYFYGDNASTGYGDGNYEYRVYAINAIGNSAYSNVLDVDYAE